MTNESPPHHFADRAFRQALQHPENLRALLKEVIPDLAAGFDYEKAKLLPRDFLLDDWRSRECDLLFEIPFREGETELATLVCILVEHQSQPDPRMPLRTLIYLVLYWERLWKAWERQSPPRPPFRLLPIVPIVLHTGSRLWSSPQTLADLLSGPTAFHCFAPTWKPLFWEVSEHSPEELLNSEDAFMQVLAIVRSKDESTADFEPVFRGVLQKLEQLHESNRVRWSDMLRIVLTWAKWQRPSAEGSRWQQVAEEVQQDAERKREVQSMGKTLGEVIYEEGRSEGRNEGRTEQTHRLLLRQGRVRFGPPNEETENALRSIKDTEKLEALSERILFVSTWAELLETT